MFTTHTIKQTLENENSKRTRTSSQIVCNEKEAQWMHILFHCKGRFGTVRMLVKTPWNLDMYPTMDHKQMKMIDVDYSVRVGYCASRNNMQEYKMYVIVIEMFSPNFVNNL